MKNYKKLLIAILAVIFIGNLPIWNFFLGQNYIYCNSDCSFSYIETPSVGNSFANCEREYGFFLCKHPEKNVKDITLYRTFKIEPWRFWEWHIWIFNHEQFELPYKAANKSQ